MDQGLTSRRLSDRGFTSIQFLLASALALVFFAALANVVVVQYARGAVRSALDQGARAGSLTGSPVDCQVRVEQVLGDLLGGLAGDTSRFDCVAVDGLMRAEASTTIESWTFFTSDFDVELRAHAAIENTSP